MWFSKGRIYLDYASAPPVLPEAIRAMREAEKIAGNPGAIHAEGVVAKKSLEESRAQIARILECKARELIFTSGLTEANNLAILGYGKRLERTRRTLHGTHWIVSGIEHDSVLECFAEVEARGGEISHLSPDARGIIAPEVLQKALRKETVFVSIGWANNEIGTIQPLAKIARIIRAHEKAHRVRIAFHSDAGQGPLYLPTVAHSLGVDLLALGGNKLYGPHGAGALYIDKDIEISSIMAGVKQERGLRAGTENAALAAGCAAAIEVIAREREGEAQRLQKLRDAFSRELSARIPGLVVNGDLAHALPHMLNVSIPDIQSEYVTLALDAAGIAVSTKSACREGEESRSHVVAALARTEAEGWRAANTLRFSLGRNTTEADLTRSVEALARVVGTKS
jgi:cysteine desulfurase